MLSSTNLWMSFAGLLYLVVGLFLLRSTPEQRSFWHRHCRAIMVARKKGSVRAGRVANATHCIRYRI
jgi:hypothetical protein